MILHDFPIRRKPCPHLPRAGPRHKTFARRISDDRISERAWMDISPKIAGENVEWWGAASSIWQLQIGAFSFE